MFSFCSGASLPSSVPMVRRTMFVFVLFALSLAQEKAVPQAEAKQHASKPSDRWAHLPEGGGEDDAEQSCVLFCFVFVFVFFLFFYSLCFVSGDYSLGANYGPLFKGKVGGNAQDVDNDNNNNGNAFFFFLFPLF